MSFDSLKLVDELSRKHRPVLRINSHVVAATALSDTTFTFDIKDLTWLHRFVIADVVIDHTFPSMTRLK